MSLTLAAPASYTQVIVSSNWSITAQRLGYTLVFAHSLDTPTTGVGMTPNQTTLGGLYHRRPSPSPLSLPLLTNSSLIHAIAVSILCSRSLTRRPLLSSTKGTVLPFSCGDPIILVQSQQALFSNESTSDFRSLL